MQRWKKLCGVVVLGTALMVASVPGAALAQQAPAAGLATAAPETNPVTNRTMFRPRDLMSSAERDAYRESMRTAPDDQVRARIRSEWQTQLRQRAADRGGVLAEEPSFQSKEANRNGEKEGSPQTATRPPPRAL